MWVKVSKNLEVEVRDYDNNTVKSCIYDEDNLLLMRLKVVGDIPDAGKVFSVGFCKNSPSLEIESGYIPYVRFTSIDGSGDIIDQVERVIGEIINN